MKRVCPLDRVVPKQTKLEARKSTAAEQRKGSASWRSSPAQQRGSMRPGGGWIPLTQTPTETGAQTEAMTIMRCGEMLEMLASRSGASRDRWLSENSQGGKICST